jgi:hypothetical protein
MHYPKFSTFFIRPKTVIFLSGLPSLLQIFIMYKTHRCGKLGFTGCVWGRDVYSRCQGSCSCSLELIKGGLMDADVFTAVSASCNLVLLYSFFGPCHSYYIHGMIYSSLYFTRFVNQTVSWNSFWEALSKSGPTFLSAHIPHPLSRKSILRNLPSATDFMIPGSSAPPLKATKYLVYELNLIKFSQPVC